MMVMAMVKLYGIMSQMMCKGLYRYRVHKSQTPAVFCEKRKHKAAQSFLSFSKKSLLTLTMCR